MRNADYFKNKDITVVGLARTGLACANLLAGLGSRVSVSDSCDNELTRLNASKLKSKEIKFELGRHSPDFIKGRDLIVVSPGVEDRSLPVAWANDFKIPIVSEIEVGYLLCPATIIAVTGSNGKTTVTTLIGKVLEASAETVFTCGNIGNPFCGEVAKMKDGDFVSLEVSSFQLERIAKFRPRIAVILNFSRNHLDRYRDMQEYLAAKKRIFRNQSADDFLVLNSADCGLKDLAKEAKSRVVYFQKTEALNPNQAAVAEVAGILGISRELCLEVFGGFKGVEHRQEYTAEINNIKFINDSKSTTVESTLWALESIREPVVLIAGGRDKGLDYRGILPAAQKKVKKVILIGEAREKLKNAFQGSLAFSEALSMEEAVSKAYEAAAAGDCVLLSPMCSSFDMFSDYEHRGRVFKKAVQELSRL